MSQNIEAISKKGKANHDKKLRIRRKKAFLFFRLINFLTSNSIISGSITFDILVFPFKNIILKIN
ncbi:hypothetical protein DR100_01640 [Mycoplasma hyopneumoniae]|nr:hypothetical protein [Mesomycoplasma hyopneumoniae]MXR34992.1 hypothetical protein [Mesomycoplasma hyopneumoniae]MXR44183.1 hypothetical protein [Mesomycoplasma hyopneumoniae]